MFNFLKGSLRELKHVVWPTRKETKKYFIIVLTVLVLFGTYLFLASNVFSTALFYLKDIFGNNQIETKLPDLDLNNTGTTASGNIIDNNIEIDSQTGVTQ